MAPVHTLGDLMLFLPDEKMLITGDVVVYPIPYFFGGGYPYSGVKVLEAIDQMDIKTIVPGHGGVLNDKIYLEQEIDLLKNVISLVEAEVYKEGLLGIKLENVQKALDLSAFKKQFSKGIKENEDFFDEAISKGLVEEKLFPNGTCTNKGTISKFRKYPLNNFFCRLPTSFTFPFFARSNLYSKLFFCRRISCCFFRTLLTFGLLLSLVSEMRPRPFQAGGNGPAFISSRGYYFVGNFHRLFPKLLRSVLIHDGG